MFLICVAQSKTAYRTGETVTRRVAPSSETDCEARFTWICTAFSSSCILLCAGFSSGFFLQAMYHGTTARERRADHAPRQRLLKHLLRRRRYQDWAHPSTSVPGLGSYLFFGTKLSVSFAAG